MPVLLVMLLAQTQIADGGQLTPEGLVAVDGGWLLAYSDQVDRDRDDAQYLARLDAQGAVVSTRRLTDGEGLHLAGSGDAFGITYVTHTPRGKLRQAWVQVIGADGEPKGKAVAVIANPTGIEAPIAWNPHTRIWAIAHAAWTKAPPAPGEPEVPVVTKLARISETGEERGVTEIDSAYGAVEDIAAFGEGFVVLVNSPLRLIEWNGATVGRVTPITDADVSSAVLVRDGRGVLTFDDHGVMALHSVEKGTVKKTVLARRGRDRNTGWLKVWGRKLLWWEGADTDKGRLWAAPFDGVKLGKARRFDSADETQLWPVVSGAGVVWARGNYQTEPTELWFSAAP